MLIQGVLPNFSYTFHTLDKRIRKFLNKTKQNTTKHVFYFFDAYIQKKRPENNNMQQMNESYSFHIIINPFPKT